MNFYVYNYQKKVKRQNFSNSKKESDMSKQYVIDTMKELLDCKRGADFAREMGVSRQALNSYKNSNADRITDRIVDRLLKQVEKRDQFIDRLKGRLKAIEDVAGEN